MRRRPSEYLEYLSQIIEGHLSNRTVDRFCELCATRDLIVHAQGKINEEYLAKARAQARAKLGEIIVVDKRYFDSSMVSIKDLYRAIHSIMRRKYVKDQKVDAVFSTMNVMAEYSNLINSLTGATEAL